MYFAADSLPKYANSRKGKVRIMKNYYRKFMCLVSLILAGMTVFPSVAGSETAACCTDEKNAVTAMTTNDGVKVSSRFWELFVGSKDKEEEKVLIPGGMVFGAKVKQAHVTVSEADGISSVKPGDQLISLGGKSISSVADVKEVLSECDGSDLAAIIQRGKSSFKVSLSPRLENDGYRLGLTLRDGAAGIGTITYIDPETGCFGGLGHGICDAESGEVIDITAGSVTGVILGGVVKGASGKPGELSGILTDKPLGEVYSNTECGVFGKLDTPLPKDTLEVPIGHRSDVHEGKACIYSTVKNGKCTKFDIEITEVNSSSHGTKSFKIKVTDPALLAITGGIVKGMSGSPIIQDGKLVGAVTHVMVANPTEGYGIFIENMLAAAQNQIQPKAA